MTDAVCALPLRERAALWWLLALIPALALTALLAAAVVWLFYAGVGIWGIDWPVAWGFAIIDYVWWIAIASGGTFISALFYLVRAEWRTSLNRMAETMTVFAAACAGIYPILHLGRPWLFYWLFPYPNTMTIWPQFRSPLLWDFFAILTYVTASILFWYFGMLPDLATMRDRSTTRRRQLFYGVLAMGFRGTGREWRHYHAAYAAFAAIMAPLVISVHSIVGLDFAGRPPSDGIRRSSLRSLYSGRCCRASPWCCSWPCRCGVCSGSRNSSPVATSTCCAGCCSWPAFASPTLT